MFRKGESKEEPLLRGQEDVETGGGKVALGYNTEAAGKAGPVTQPLLAPKKSHSSLNRVAALAKPETPIIAIATIALLISTAATVAIPQFFGQMIDDISETKDIAHLNRTLITMGLVFLVGSFFTFVRAYYFTVAGERVVARLRKTLFYRIQAQEIGFFDGEKTGELINR